MNVRSVVFVLTFVLLFAVSACNLPSNVPATGTPTLTLTPTLSLPTATITQTVVPSDTPAPTTTSTPTVPVAFPKEVSVNCRRGPSIGWVSISGLTVGTSAQIVGKSADGGWWYIVDPLNSGGNCWVATSVTNTSGNLAGIPVVDAPKSTVTQVTVGVSPNALSVASCASPILPLEIRGTIEADGPGPVTWHFETQQGGPMAAQTTNFDAYGANEVLATYTPPTPLTAGTYWVRLVVTSPNNMQAETRYTITCPP